MKKKIVRSTMIVALAVLLASFTIILSCLYDYFAGIQDRQMRDELRLAIAGVEAGGEDYLNDLTYQDLRLTWVAPKGSVFFDSRADEDEMENHADRKEIRAAFATGEGSASRYSSTIMEKTQYHALRLEDGSVLRIAASRATAGLLLIGMFQPIAVVILLAVVLSVVLAGQVAKRITEPLNRLDLDDPLENETYEELALLLERIHRQHQQIDRTMGELDQRKEEFMQITNSMNEGLVLLNEKGMILTICPRWTTGWRCPWCLWIC